MMQTRDILDKDGNVIGELSLPEETTEYQWAQCLAQYAVTVPLPTLDQIIEAKFLEAQQFGVAVSDRFIKQNIALGITQLGLTNKVRKVLREVKDALETGSIYDAVTEIRSLDINDFDSTIITAERVLAFRNEIETWLEVPLAENWDDPETWL